MSRVKAPRRGQTSRGKPESADEASEHILTCVVCGQSFDIRDEAQLEHHEREMHHPLPRH
jgi:Fe2+ or Zn2+ uptake regulation protein